MTEHYLKGLGQTIKEIKELIPKIEPIEKIEFNCFGSNEFKNALKKLEAKTTILA
ncbi:MAG: hypothetical protein ACUVTD_04280 [Nitrososphaerales archaeon]